MRGWAGRRTHLSVLELNEITIVNDDLIAVVFTLAKTLWQRKPLSGHLVAIIGIYKLVIIDAVGSVTLNAFDCGLTTVESDDIIDESLSGRTQRQ